MQQYYGMPAWFLGILVDSDDIEKIRALKPKEAFQTKEISPVRGIRDIEDPFDLTQVEQEIARYQSLVVKPIWKQAGVGRKTRRMERTTFLSSCQSILDDWLRRDLKVVATGIMEVRIHELYEKDPRPNSLDSMIGLTTPNPTTKIVFESKGSFSEAVELARLIVWHRFLSLRRENISFVKLYFRENNSEVYKHLVQVRWPRTNLDVYANVPAECPEVVIKTGHGLLTVPLSKGTRISMYPVARCCVGMMPDSLESPYVCARKGASLPYGEVLPLDGGDIRCLTCISDADRLKFGIKSASRVAKNQEAILGQFSDDLYYVYLSLFGRRLKVGRARLSRGIARMVEQGAADALVIFPLTSYRQADAFESELVVHLKSKLNDMSQLGIEAVADKAYARDKLELILERYHGDFGGREHIYEEVVRLLKCSKSIEIKLAILQRRIISFLPNWTIPENPEVFSRGEFHGYLTQISGTVRGIIGSMLVVDDALVDLERLQGCIFRGGGFE